MGGVQIADVSVDTETGLVKINKMVAVQDCGLIITMKTAESQCYGALIMGITYALFEEKIMDQITGRMLNNNMAQVAAGQLVLDTLEQQEANSI